KNNAKREHAENEPGYCLASHHLWTPVGGVSSRERVSRKRARSYCDPFVIGGPPAPGSRAIAAFDNAILEDLANDLAVARYARFSRAHPGAERQLAGGQGIRAVLGEFARRTVRLRTAGAIGALVHLAARAEVSNLRVLLCTERTGVEAIAAADAEVLGPKHHGIIGYVETVHRAYRRAGCVSAVHAGH